MNCYACGIVNISFHLICLMSARNWLSTQKSTAFYTIYSIFIYFECSVSVKVVFVWILSLYSSFSLAFYFLFIFLVFFIFSSSCPFQIALNALHYFCSVFLCFRFLRLICDFFLFNTLVLGALGRCVRFISLASHSTKKTKAFIVVIVPLFWSCRYVHILYVHE